MLSLPYHLSLDRIADTRRLLCVSPTGERDDEGDGMRRGHLWRFGGFRCNGTCPIRGVDVSCVRRGVIDLIESNYFRMDFLRRIEDDVRNLGVEAKRKYPEVREAAERGLMTLRTMRESYVSEVMRGNGASTPKIAKFRSSEVSAPYILACEKVEPNSKLVKLSLNGLQMLLNYEVVPPSEAKGILKVLQIQANSGNTEVQLKVLQIVLQLANSLSADSYASQYLTTDNVCGMMTLALQLCGVDVANVSVSSTAFATVRQLVALVMDAAGEALTGAKGPDRHGRADSQVELDASSTQASTTQTNLPWCAELLVFDLTLFLKNKTGEWIQNVHVSVSAALDLLHAILSGWTHLFMTFHQFQVLLKESVCGSLIPLLKTLQEDYVSNLRTKGVPPTGGLGGTPSFAVAMTSRVVRLARCIILEYQQLGELMMEIETIITSLVHTLQPERGVDMMVRQLPGSIHMLGETTTLQQQTTGAGGIYRGNEESLQSSGLISRLGMTKQSSGSGGGAPLKANGLLPLGILGTSAGSTQNNVIFIPAHPPGVCLEAVFALFLSQDIFCVIARGDNGKEALPTVLASVILTVVTMLSEAVLVDSNVREFELHAKGSNLVVMMDAVLSGSSDMDREFVLRSIHDQLFNSSPSIQAVDVLLLAFLVLQIVSRLLVKYSISTSPSVYSGDASPGDVTVGLDDMKASSSHSMSSFFPATCDGSLQPHAASEGGVEGPDNHVNSIVRSSVAIVCERTFDKAQEACLALLANVEDVGVVRRILGVLAELSLTAGLLGLQRSCDTLISTLARLTVPQWHGQEMILLMHEQSMREREQYGGAAGTAAPPSSLVTNVAVCPEPLQLRWRHVQAFVRLTQVVHVLADVITDWEVVMDSFEQLVAILLSSTSIAASSSGSSSKESRSVATHGIVHEVLHEELTPNEIDKMLQCIERFNGFTMFMSDDALVRLMTALVALSLNALAVSATSTAQNSSGNSTSASASGSTASPVPGGILQLLSGNSQATVAPTETCPAYMITALSRGHISYSLHSAVEIAKINSFRMSCVWQMVTSHLRMMTTHKVLQTRRVAVLATHDMILTALTYLRNPKVELSSGVAFTEAPSSSENAVLPVGSAKFFSWLTDDVLFDRVMPSFETVFAGRGYQRTALLSVLAQSCDVASSGSVILQLTQADLLSSLRSLASHSRYDDVRIDVMQGLLKMLQERGQAVSGGWEVILDLITSVPASLVPFPTSNLCDREYLDENRVSNEFVEESSDKLPGDKKWPEAALSIAFSCMELIVDDFLELIFSQKDAIRSVVGCLSTFSAQTSDINISLTAVEMLWKVTDYIMTTSRQRGDEATTTTVLEIMLKRLLVLAMDQRPEIRNCAINTLFSAIVSNASMMSSLQWKQAFDEVIFPLFRRVEARSGVAMRSKEEAKAPEIKRGVKMTLHHSRDNAHKQWSETRVLALRGLTRVVRGCIKHLLTESWFHATWTQALEICVRAARSDEFDLEISLAGVDSLFDTIKSVSCKTYKTKARAGHGMRVVGGALVEDTDIKAAAPAVAAKGSDAECLGNPGEVSTELAREALWSSAWDAIRLSTCFSSSGHDLPLHVCKHMQELYNGGDDAEFRYSQNVKSMLEIIVVLARPRIVVEIVSTPMCDGEETAGNQQCHVTRFIEPAETLHAGPGDIRPNSARLSETQLCRGVMSLIRAVRPVDILSFSSLVTTIADLCFLGCQYVSMPSLHSPLQAMPSQSNAPVEMQRTVLFAPVDEQLRSESGKYLISLMKGDVVGADESVPEWCASVSEEWLSIALEVISNRFVRAACSPLICARLPDMPQLPFLKVFCEDVQRDDAVSTAQSVPRPTEKGFLASLARMLTLEEGDRTDMISPAQEPAASHTCATLSSNLFRMIPVHVILNSKKGNNCLAEQDWIRLPTHMSCFRPFVVIMESSLSVLSNRRNKAKANDSVIHQLLITIACIFAPWRTHEVFAAGPLGGEFMILEVPSVEYHPSWRQDQLLCHPSFEELSREYAVLARTLFGTISTCFVAMERRPSVQHPLSHLIDVVVSCCCLILAAVRNDQSADYAGPRNSMLFHFLVLENCREFLVSLLAAEGTESGDNVPSDTKARTLLGLLTIISDLCDTCVDLDARHLPAGSAVASSSQLHSICAGYLKSFSSVDTEFSILPSVDDVLRIREHGLSLYPALELWSRSLQLIIVALTDNSSGGAWEKESDTGSSCTRQSPPVNHGIAATCRKFHVYMCMDFVSRLVECPSMQVREEAVKILRSASVSEMLASYRDVYQETSSLKTQVQFLSDELRKVKSAASLQF